MHAFEFLHLGPRVNPWRGNLSAFLLPCVPGFSMVPFSRTLVYFQGQSYAGGLFPHGMVPGRKTQTFSRGDRALESHDTT